MHGSTGGRWKRSDPDGQQRVPGRCAEKRHPNGLIGTQPSDQSPPRQRSTLPPPCDGPLGGGHALRCGHLRPRSAVGGRSAGGGRQGALDAPSARPRDGPAGGPEGVVTTTVAPGGAAGDPFGGGVPGWGPRVQAEEAGRPRLPRLPRPGDRGGGVRPGGGAGPAPWPDVYLGVADVVGPDGGATT